MTASRPRAGPTTPTTSSRRLAWLLLWITPALWSSNYLIARAADGVVTPHVLALLRWLEPRSALQSQALAEAVEDLVKATLLLADVSRPLRR